MCYGYIFFLYGIYLSPENVTLKFAESTEEVLPAEKNIQGNVLPFKQYIYSERNHMICNFVK